MLELRERQDAEQWLYAGLCLMRVARPSPETIGSASHWILSTLTESAVLPPPGVVADIGQLVTDGELDFSGTPFPHERLRKVLRSYEDQVLGRLANSARIEAACDAIARVPRHLRGEAIALFVVQVLQRIGFTGGVSIPPGVARHLTSRPATEIVDVGLAQLREGDDVVDQLAEGYEALVDAVRTTGTLIGDAEVFALENLEVLRGMAERLAIRQILDGAEALGRTLPKRIKPRSSRRGTTPTRLDDESAYPTGGFASISNSGSIENLVISELIYMEDDPDEDLFDVRYAEGELLYYTRDESVFVRNRRAFTFVFTPDLVKARFKDKGLDWQRLVLALGMVLCCVRRLTDWLDREGLTFRVAFVKSPAGGNPLQAEQDLMALALQEWVDKDMAEIVGVDSVAAALKLANADAANARSDAVVITMSDAELPEENRVTSTRLDLSGPVPTLPDLSPDPDGDRWQAWASGTLALLETIA